MLNLCCIAYTGFGAVSGHYGWHGNQTWRSQGGSTEKTLGKWGEAMLHQIYISVDFILTSLKPTSNTPKETYAMNLNLSNCKLQGCDSCDFSDFRIFITNFRTYALKMKPFVRGQSHPWNLKIVVVLSEKSSFSGCAWKVLLLYGLETWTDTKRNG